MHLRSERCFSLALRWFDIKKEKLLSKVKDKDLENKSIKAVKKKVEFSHNKKFIPLLVFLFLC